MRTFLWMGLWMAIVFNLPAQHQELNEKPASWKQKEGQAGDTTKLLDAFRSGIAQGHFRYYFMATDNAPGLTDYYANAAGGGLRFESGSFHGLRFAISGFYIFNIGSSDLGKLDSVTGQGNRYEIGLFDLENPYNHKDNDRLEELYLAYGYKGFNIKVGRQLINTPFLNLQDGRMRPTGVEGVYSNWKLGRKLNLEGGWLYAISPRSTTKWYDLDESIGLYPSGMTTSGVPSSYAGNLHSKGVFMVGSKIELAEGLQLQAWDLFTENILNAAMLQLDYARQLKGGNKIYFAGQAIRQDAVAEGGSAETGHSYIDPGAKAFTFGGKAGYKSKSMDIALNYNRITAQGRYLMPREWGRDPFFTFMPRERNEGLGDVHAVMGKVERRFPKARMKGSLAAGYYALPKPNDFELNKYGMPSYGQVNLDIRHEFGGSLEGLDAQLLVFGKLSKNDLLGNRRFEFNKVNMLGYNLIFNYHF